MPMAPHEAVMNEFREAGRFDEWLTPRERFDANEIMRTQWGMSHGVADYKRAQRAGRSGVGSAIELQYVPDEGSKRAAAGTTSNGRSTPLRPAADNFDVDV